MGSRGLIWVVGLGPGVEGLLTPLARMALEAAQDLVGYGEYLRRAAALVSCEGKSLYPFPMGGELARCRKALELAERGRRVALVSSGDPGIYGMAGPLLDMAQGRAMEVEVVPGVPALSAVAARLGAPLMGDFALISLSDVLVPWEGILYRLEHALAADMVLVFYNPGSPRRRYHLSRAMRVVAHGRFPDTPVGVVSRAFSPQERKWLGAVRDLMDGEFTDMSATVVVGSSRTRVVDGRMVTDRGYGAGEEPCWPPTVELSQEGLSGSEIEERSLSFIEQGLAAYPLGPWERAVVARAVHAVADFSIAPLMRFSPGAVARGVELLRRGVPIWVDTRMALAGISRSLAEGLGCRVGVPPGADDPPPGCTRSAWAFEALGEGLRGALVAVGNAPTALETLVRMANRGLRPGLVIGVPVGFVGTARAKRALVESDLDYIALLGNRGGTPIAVAVVNALLRLATADHDHRRRKREAHD